MSAYSPLQILISWNRTLILGYLFVYKISVRFVLVFCKMNYPFINVLKQLP